MIGRLSFKLFAAMDIMRISEIRMQWQIVIKQSSHSSHQSGAHICRTLVN